MYWSDFKKIERAGLDGTRREVIVTDENNWPTGITLDLASERLYWLGFKMHTISSCNFDGSKRTLILSSRKWISNAYAITMFQDSVYWSNYGQNAIIKANKLDGSSVTSVKNLFSVRSSLVNYLYPIIIEIIIKILVTSGEDTGGGGFASAPGLKKNDLFFRSLNNCYAGSDIILIL